MPVNAASITSVEPVAHGTVPRRIECRCTLKNRLLYQVLFEQHPYFVRRTSRALQHTDALAAAEYGWLAVWEHSALFSGLGAASIAAGRCISAGAPSRTLTRFHF